MTKVAVIVPTYRRPEPLAQCLAALAAQDRAPDEVLVVARRGDEDSSVTAGAAPLRCTVLEIDEEGVLAAMAAGARAATSEILCFTDDDAVAPPGWITEILARFDTAPVVGAVGGRDVIFDGEVRRVEARAQDVGRLTWFGRHVGNHHLGTGPCREVAFLKGVNAAYRRAALGIPLGLRGSGAQAHFEIAVGRHARSRGFTLVYDPALTVRHRPAGRLGEDTRADPSRVAVSDAAYNLVVGIGGVRGVVRCAYAVAIGDRGCPGVLRGLLALATRDTTTARKVAPSMSGTLAGGWALMRGRGLTYETFD
jgi:GT2 family glycosyltransferase